MLIIALAVVILTACGGQQTGTESQHTPSDGQETAQTPETPVPPEQQEQPAQDESEADSTQDPEQVPQQSDSEPARFALEVDGFLIEMDQDIDYVLAALGEPLGEFVAPSCAFDGEDRIFQYPSLQIHTYPVGDNDFVHTVMLRDDNIRTSEGGIRMGATLDDVIAAYGDDFVKDFNMYTFTRDRTTLEFYIEDGIVMGITFGLIIEQ